MPHVMEATQTASAPGRYMFEAVITSIDVVTHAAHANLDMAMVLADLRKAFDLIVKRYVRAVIRITCGQAPDPDEKDVSNDHPAVVLVLVAIGYGSNRHWREVEVNGRRTRRVELGGGFPQGLSPSPLFYAVCGEGLNGLLANVGVQGVEVPISDTVKSIQCRQQADKHSRGASEGHM